MTLYCDLAIEGNTLWSGAACLNNVLINSRSYLGFLGNIGFTDMQGSLDPVYTGLGPGDRFVLLYADVPGNYVQIPLEAIPSQQLDIMLGTQYCTISIYEK